MDVPHSWKMTVECCLQRQFLYCLMGMISRIIPILLVSTLKTIHDIGTDTLGIDTLLTDLQES